MIYINALKGCFSCMVKVLCVDDDRPILDGLRQFDWGKWGCEWVGEASDGRTALSLLSTLKPALILVDIMMPIMDGLSFIPLAKERLPEAKFMILSAHCDFEYARRAMRYGVMEYLTKGEFTDDELGNALMRLTKQQPAPPSYRYEVEKTLELMRDHLGEEISLEMAAIKVGISPNYLGNLFYQQTGVRFRDHLTKLRMERARELLMHTPLKIYEVAQQVGIQNPQYFTSLFQKFYGVTPGQLRR